MKTLFFKAFLLLIFFSSGLTAEQIKTTDFTTIVKTVSEGTVAIAIDAPIKHSSPRVLGTGFVVADGLLSLIHISEPTRPY